MYVFIILGVYTTMGSRRSTFSQIPLVAEETWEEQRLNTRMAYSDFELEFAFVFKDESWIVGEIFNLQINTEYKRDGCGFNSQFIIFSSLFPMKYFHFRKLPEVTRQSSALRVSSHEISKIRGNSGNDKKGPNCLPCY